MSKYKSQLHPAAQFTTISTGGWVWIQFKGSEIIIFHFWKDVGLILKDVNKKSECWACWHPLLNMSWKILKTFEVWREGHLCKLQALIGFPLVSIIVTQIQSSEFRTFSVTPGTEMSRQGGREEEKSHDSYSGLGAGYGLRGQIKIRSQSSPEISRFPHTSSEHIYIFVEIFFLQFCSNIFRLSPILLMNRLQRLVFRITEQKWGVTRDQEMRALAH